MQAGQIFRTFPISEDSQTGSFFTNFIENGNEILQFEDLQPAGFEPTTTGVLVLDNIINICICLSS